MQQVNQELLGGHLNGPRIARISEKLVAIVTGEQRQERVAIAQENAAVNQSLDSALYTASTETASSVPSVVAIKQQEVEEIFDKVHHPSLHLHVARRIADPPH